ncbi:MAG: ATP-binding protein [bacterium]|nr:ATP-binding protein [bacterium]
MSTISHEPKAAAATPFADSRQHLRAEMAWLELILKREMAVAKRCGKLGPVDEFAGMYVSEDEIRRYLTGAEPAAEGRPAEGPAEAPDSDAEVRALDERLRRTRLDVDRRAAAAIGHGVDLRLPRLADRFGLSDTEIRILLLCVAPDVDVRFHRCFAYLQNDVGKKRPSVQFLARVCDGFRDVLDARALLGPDAPLLRHRLLLLPQRTDGREVPIPVQQPVVSSGVLDFVFGLDRLDERLAAFAELVEPRPMRPFGAYDRHLLSIRDRLLGAARSHGDLPLAYVGGPTGCQRARLVEQVARDSGRCVLRARAAGLFAAAAPVGDSLALLARDAVLHHALLHLEEVDDPITENGRPAAAAAALRTWLESEPRVPVLLTGTRPPAEIGGALGVPFSAYSIPHPSIEERSEIWSTLLEGAPGDESRRLIDALAAKFRFTPGQIRSAVRAATATADARAADAGAAIVGIEDLHRCCRQASNQRLLAYAQKIVPKYGWDDIVLTPETRNQLREICAAIRYRRTVYGRWGFEEKFSVGNGVNALFAGPSGTGKTMSAEIIAGDLELDLYKIDLSCVVSKYVGETERNLEKIFDEAETSNSILFFDEADALFGKRSEIKDAHDRYANIEINYLLQKMDDYEGIVILATNLKGNMDAAFTRRLSHVVDFSAPDAELRRWIWAKVFPAAVPLASDADFDFLARKFQLSGGNIKNVAVNSAFMAARAGDPVCMVHLIRATKREFQKLGKLCSKSEFGPYLNLVRTEAEA